MEWKIKKFLIFATVFCFLLTFPLEFAQAQGFLNVLMSIPTNIINILLQVLLLVSNAIVGIASLILNWVISPYFTTLPYTSGGIVDVGWPIVRDFVNMLFIVALVIIGLATALRIKEYQFQKALPRLIIIAILINFTPVICGLIMDAQNIFMNFFLEEVTGFKLLGNLFATQGTALWQALIHFFDIRYAATLLGKTIGMIAFDWIAAFVFLMYAILFIMRYIMIWVLVIVSPLAFFSWVFPGSQKYLFKSILGWEEWWKQFIEWSMIGIIGAFFLYLGEQLLILAPNMFSTPPPEAPAYIGWLTTPVVEFINSLLPYGVVLAFLIIGFFTATSTSAMGAGAITGFFKEQGMMIGRAATEPFRRAGTRLISAGAERLAKTWELTGEKALGKIPILGKPLQRGVEAVAVAPLRRYVARARRIDFDEMFKGMEAGEMAKQIGTLSKEDRVTAAAWMAEKGFLDKVPGKSVPVLDEEGNPIPLLDEEGKQMIDPETGKPLFKTKTINPFHDQMAKEATDLAERPEYRKSATDVLETLAGKVNEKVSLKLETDPTAKAKLKIEIGKIAKEISKDEKIKVEIEARAKEEGISFEQAARDMAARQIWTGALKSGDVKDMAKSSFDDAGVRRGTEMWHSGQWQALMNNFKKPVVDKTLNEPGGLNYMVRKEGTAFLEQFAKKNPRGFNFFVRSPGGREWNFEGLKYMLDPEGRPTTRVADFERRIRIKEILGEEAKKKTKLPEFYNLQKEKEEIAKEIEKLRREGRPTAEIEKAEERFKDATETLKELWETEIKNTPLEGKWEEIESLRRPPKPSRRRKKKGPPGDGASTPGGPKRPSPAPAPTGEEKEYTPEEIALEAVKGALKETRREKRKPSTSSAARVPFMITRKMEEDLKKRGYTQEQINKMTPEEAARILGLI